MRERWRRGATRARARDARGRVVDVGSGEDNADRIAASAGGAGDGDARRGTRGRAGAARGLCGDRARVRGARRAARARARARAGAGTIVSREGFARARDRRETRETDGDSYVYDDS